MLRERVGLGCRKQATRARTRHFVLELSWPCLLSELVQAAVVNGLCGLSAYLWRLDTFVASSPTVDALHEGLAAISNASFGDSISLDDEAVELLGDMRIRENYMDGHPVKDIGQVCWTC